MGLISMMQKIKRKNGPCLQTDTNSLADDYSKKRKNSQINNKFNGFC